MSAARGIWAVVPVKDLARAKQRLAGRLAEGLRRELALAMLEDVLEALAAAAALEGVLIVTREPRALDLARRRGLEVLRERRNRGHSAAVAAAARRLAARGCAGMLALPGDVPLASAAEIRRLLAAHGPAPAVTLVPARDGRGSNAVACSPPDVMALRFGEDSFGPHRERARRAGLGPRVLQLAGIGLDIDRPGDLDAFSAVPSATRSHALLRAAGLLPAAPPARAGAGGLA